MKATTLDKNNFPDNAYFRHIANGVKHYHQQRFERAIEEWTAAERIEKTGDIDLMTVESNPRLRADLEEIPLLFFFMTIYMHKLSGIGAYQSESSSQKFVFRKGILAYAESIRQETRIGNYIMNLKKDITAGKIADLCEEAKSKKQLLGQFAVQKGLINQHELKDILQLQLEEIFGDSLFWNQGNILFLEKRLKVKPVLEISPLLMAINAAQNKFNVDNFRKEIPDNKIIFRPSPYLLQSEDITAKLNTNELFILSLVDGFRNIDQLIRFSGASEASTINILYRLSRLGLIRKTKEIGEYEDKEYKELTQIIDLLEHIFKLLHNELHKEIGRKGREIISTALENLEENHRLLFADMQFDDTKKLDKEKILNNLASNFPRPEERTIVIEAFHDLYSKILVEFKKFLGLGLTKGTLTEMKRIRKDINTFSVQTIFKSKLIGIFDEIINNYS